MAHKRNKRKRKTKKVDARLSSSVRAIQYPPMTLSEKELGAALLEAGKKHRDEFDTLLPKVVNIICSCNPLHVLSTLSAYGLFAGITKTGKIQKEKYGSLTQAHVELAQECLK